MKSKLPYLIILGFIMANFLIYLKFYTYYGVGIKGTDGQMYYAYVRSMILDKDLNFSNEFGDLAPDKNILSPKLSPTGYIENRYGTGYGLLSIPFFLLAHLLTYLSNFILGTKLPLDGYSKFYDFIVPLGHLIYGSIGIYVIYKISCRYFAETVSAVSTVVLWFGGSLIYYTSVYLTMAHSSSVFLIALFIYVFIRFKESESKWWLPSLLGIVAGLMVQIRYSNVIYLFLPLTYFLYLGVANRNIRGFLELRKQLGRYLIAGLFFIIICIPQFIVWKVIYGRYICYSYGQAKLDLSHPHFWETFFSSNHGLIYWSPVSILAIIGLAMLFFKKSQIELKILAVIFLLFVYVNSSYPLWKTGSTFGSREYNASVPVLVLGLAYCGQMFRRKCLKICLYTSYVFFIFWNILLMISYITNLIPCNREMSMKSIIEIQRRCFYNLVKHCEH